MELIEIQCTKTLTFLIFVASLSPFQGIGERGICEKSVTKYGIF
jgi:hypothetical protein